MGINFIQKLFLRQFSGESNIFNVKSTVRLQLSESASLELQLHIVPINYAGLADADPISEYVIYRPFSRPIGVKYQRLSSGGKDILKIPAGKAGSSTLLY